MAATDKSVKISADKIVPSPVIILSENDPLTKKLNENKIIVLPAEKSRPAVKASPYRQSSPVEVEGALISESGKDAPDLSDITIHTPLVAKRRKGSNEIYYEIVYKVRNSSATPSNVVGVDARIVGTEPEND